jgi:hypothetical protein
MIRGFLDVIELLRGESSAESRAAVLA